MVLIIRFLNVDIMELIKNYLINTYGGPKRKLVEEPLVVKQVVCTRI